MVGNTIFFGWDFDPVLLHGGVVVSDAVVPSSWSWTWSLRRTRVRILVGVIVVVVVVDGVLPKKIHRSIILFILRYTSITLKKTDSLNELVAVRFIRFLIAPCEGWDMVEWYTEVLGGLIAPRLLCFLKFAYLNALKSKILRKSTRPLYFQLLVILE